MNDKKWIVRYALILNGIVMLLSFLYILDNFNRSLAVDSRIWALFWTTVGLNLLVIIKGIFEQFKRKPKPPEKDM